ncbi:hypothetical protein NKH75_23960 [Mesorhizobium sp. M0984]|uniref:hypothetical protein n=1 Tax=Mesorhizobium sp. M0984 TaxID=2957041 RepID=UPI003335FB20
MQIKTPFLHSVIQKWIKLANGLNPNGYIVLRKVTGSSDPRSEKMLIDSYKTETLTEYLDHFANTEYVTETRIKRIDYLVEGYEEAYEALDPKAPLDAMTIRIVRQLMFTPAYDAHETRDMTADPWKRFYEVDGVVFGKSIIILASAYYQDRRQNGQKWI